MDNHRNGAHDVHRTADDETAYRPGVSGSHRHPLRHGCARCQGGILRLQRHVGGCHWRAVCGSGRPDAYGRAAVCREVPLRPAQQLFEGRRATDAACGRAEFIPQQHHRGKPLCRYREDVVEETGHLALQAAHPPELCLGHGWRVYAHRHAAQPDHLRPLCRQDGNGDEHIGHHRPRPVLSLRRCAQHHRHAPLAARPQGT